MIAGAVLVALWYGLALWLFFYRLGEKHGTRSPWWEWLAFAPIVFTAWIVDLVRKIRQLFKGK